jgi:hypothetical protein
VQSGREAVTLLNHLRDAGTPATPTADAVRPRSDPPSLDPG